eukprot:scaffold48685_cov20-Tisochrysis_lutea.AAC.2
MGVIIVLRQQQCGKATAVWSGKTVVVRQQHCGKAKPLWSGYNIVVRQQHCGQATTLWSGKSIVVRHQQCGKATAVWQGNSSVGEVAAAGGVGGGSKWTAKYLKNSELHEVVNTLLELAFSAPHPALRAGKVVIHITPGKFPAFSGKVR